MFATTNGQVQRGEKFPCFHKSDYRIRIGAISIHLSGWYDQAFKWMLFMWCCWSFGFSLEFELGRGAVLNTRSRWLNKKKRQKNSKDWEKYNYQSESWYRGKKLKQEMVETEDWLELNILPLNSVTLSSLRMKVRSNINCVWKKSCTFPRLYFHTGRRRLQFNKFSARVYMRCML